MSGTQIPSGSVESTALTAAIRARDEEAFNHLAGRHRRELLIHCYRMLGSLDDAEDAVQDNLSPSQRRVTAEAVEHVDVPEIWCDPTGY